MNPKKKKTSKLVIIAIVIPLFVCLLLVALFSPKTQDAQPPTPNWPTWTAAPTNTPAPIATAKPTPSIPGIQPVDVTLNLKGFDCPTPDSNETGYIWHCRKSVGNIDVSVDVWARSLSTVDSIDVILTQTNPDEAFSAEELGYIATFPFVDNKSLQDAAKKWVAVALPMVKKQGDSQETTINGVKFVLSGIPTGRVLDIGSVDAWPLPQ